MGQSVKTLEEPLFKDMSSDDCYIKISPDTLDFIGPMAEIAETIEGRAAILRLMARALQMMTLITEGCDKVDAMTPEEKAAAMARRARNAG